MYTEDGVMPEAQEADVDRQVAAASTWVRWRYSGRDGQVHAFPVEDSECGRWPQAVCAQVVPPGVLGPGVTGPRCPECVLGVTASGTGRRHRRIDPPGFGARLLALVRLRRRRPGRQSAQFPVVALPLVPVGVAERDGWAPGTAGPGSTAPDALAALCPVHRSTTR